MQAFKFKHLKQTFDGDYYSFQGNCRYLLAAKLDNSFQILAENIPCGTTGVTCTKSIDILYSSKYEYFYKA